MSSRLENKFRGLAQKEGYVMFSMADKFTKQKLK